jgi:ubiquinone/menaquinone biosynthesis C-methylase UbiE
MPRDEHSDPAFVSAQYRTSANLAARQRIYQYATSDVTWHASVFDQMRPALPPDARVLELGCGNGALWRENLDRVPPRWKVTLSDVSSGMLDDARRGLVHGASRFRFARIDAQSIPFPDQSFNAVVANHMLYHGPDRPRAYREIVRVLEPGGWLFAATNGDGHVIEIRKLIADVVPSRERGGFSLAGARDELAQFFESIELIHLRGELRVPEVQPVIDYVESMGLRQPLSAEQLDEIGRVVKGEIERRGYFRVSTETGLCRALTSASH